MIKAGEELLRLQAENQRLKEGIKQVREEIHDLKKSDCAFNCGHNAIELVEEILDKLIAESEGANGYFQ
jgi:hypothetical protein